LQRVEPADPLAVGVVGGRVAGGGELDRAEEVLSVVKGQFARPRRDDLDGADRAERLAPDLRFLLVVEFVVDDDEAPAQRLVT
jgi:hypothetical protein